jgi:hypothetical protein
MKFDVIRRASYTLDKDSVKAFKQRMVERIEEEMEDDKFACTLEDISDDIIREPLANLIQEAFEDYGNGVHFDDYFGSVWLDCGEDDVSDCIDEAIDAWISEKEE